MRARWRDRWRITTLLLGLVLALTGGPTWAHDGSVDAYRWANGAGGGVPQGRAGLLVPGAATDLWTPDYQAVLSLPAHALRPGLRTHADVQPVDAGTLGALPDGLAAGGNAYRVEPPNLLLPPSAAACPPAGLSLALRVSSRHGADPARNAPSARGRAVLGRRPGVGATRPRAGRRGPRHRPARLVGLLPGRHDLGPPAAARDSGAADRGHRRGGANQPATPPPTPPPAPPGGLATG